MQPAAASLQQPRRSSDEPMGLFAPTRTPMTRDRTFAWRLAGLCALAAAVRVLLLRASLLDDPFAALPYSDGELYWNRAGERLGATFPG